MNSDKSKLSSPRKPAQASGSTTTRRRRAMDDMVSSLGLDNITAHLCPSLADTYEDLPVFEYVCPNAAHLMCPS